MSVTPPISSFFGLDPQLLSMPAASSSLVNPLLFGTSNQMVPVNFGSFNSGIPPIFGGGGFTGFPTTPFNPFANSATLMSPFAGGAAFGTGFGTQPFGANQFAASPNGNFTFSNAPVNGVNPGTFGNGFVQMNPFSFGGFI